MNDVDIMVPQDKLQIAKDVLVSLGYLPLKPSSVEDDVSFKHHLTRLVKPNVPSIELHWNITMPRKHYTIDAVELWERAVPVQIAGANVLALSPEDLLLHLCLHTSYQHQFAFGLRPSCDIAETIARSSSMVDWDVLVQRAEQWNWRRGVYLALRLAQELVGAAAPPEVMRRLMPLDFDEHVAAAARRLILADRLVLSSVSPNLVRMWKERSVRAKGRVLAQRLFPSRAVLARIYAVPSRSPRIYLYYLIHQSMLLRRSGQAVWKLMHDDRNVAMLVDRKYILLDWLSKS